MKRYIGYINWLILILIITSIILLWLNAIHIANWFNGTTYLNHYKDLSQIGDIFGVVTSLFSALSILGIIITIYLQKQDLKLQRLELEATRNEFTIKRITEVIYHQIEIIDKTFMKLPFYYISISYEPSQDTFSPYKKNESIESKNGIDGVYKYIDDFKYDINIIISQETYQIEKNKIICILNNYSTLIYLGNSIIKSIDIIEALINNMPKSNEKNNLISIFKASIGEEIYTFFKINIIYSNYYIMNKDSYSFQYQKEYIKTMNNIVDFKIKLSDALIKVEVNLIDILKQKII